jgi:HlyD family secretion protein
MAMNGKKKTRKRIIIWSIIGVLVAALALTIFLGSRKETVITVQVEKAQRRTITQVVTATGKIQPEVQVKISPEVSGEIVALPVKEGDRVKKGDLLMKIKADLYLAGRDQASAGLLSAKADLGRTEPEFKRISSLFEKGLVSESEYDQAQALYESAKAQYARAKATLDQAEESLRKTTVFAPMDGTVSQLNSELGERVLGTQQFQGTDVMTIADLSRMESRVDVSETDVINVSIGDTARIEIDAFPDRKVNAVVYEIANTAASKGLGTQEEVTNFQVKMRVLDKDISLRPGMSMTANIETETKVNVLTIPVQSVTTRAPKMEVKDSTHDGQRGEIVQAGGPGPDAKKPEDKMKEVAFVVVDGVAKAMPVKRGISNESYVEITEGLEEGAQVVSGTYRVINRELEDGLKVKIEEPRRGRGPQQARAEGA